MGPTRPAIYVSHVLGHEGAGSLHELLSAQGWVRSLSAGPQVRTTCCGVAVLRHQASHFIAVYCCAAVTAVSTSTRWYTHGA
jgi:hypothetical protein